MEINPLEFYSAMQAQKFVGLKSRQTITKYIKDGFLRAIKVGEEKGAGRRYAIKGEWLASFIERYKKGLVKGERYTIQEQKMILEATIEYCKKNGIVTLQQLIRSIRKMK